MRSIPGTVLALTLMLAACAGCSSGNSNPAADTSQNRCEETAGDAAGCGADADAAACTAGGEACGEGRECCSGACVDGTCLRATCGEFGESCREVIECCGTMVCSNGECAPCAEAGEDCHATPCCSDLICGRPPADAGHSYGVCR